MLNLKLQVAKTSEKVEALRQEVREFLREEMEKGTFEPSCDAALSGFSREFSRKLGERGWIGMTWPKKYGGHERSSIERYTVIEELLAAGAPVSAHWICDRQHGPLLLNYGTEEQKQRFLPRMAKGELVFAIGLSEPNAGSDLANVSTRATRTDGGWLLNGNKIWTSNAHEADYMVVLCRTSPLNPEKRHDGMSQLIVDMKSPGVTVRPVKMMTGEYHFNDVFFDNVFVPDDMVIGEIGNGWKQGMAELAYERSGPERFLSTMPLLEELVRRIRDKGDQDLLARVMPLVSRLWTLRNMSLGIAQMLERGETPDIAAALVKDLGTLFEKQIAEVVRQLFSPSADSSDQLEKLMAQAILHSPAFTLRGGTTEILRGIVAKGVVR